MKKLPALQFYTGDWRKDPCVQALDYEHKGVWIELLCILNETSERGYLILPNGDPMPDDAIARNLGLPEAKWKQIRSKLLDLGVAYETDEGVLYNRRIARDEHIRQMRAEAGRKGGRASKPKQAQSKDEANNEAKRGSSVSSSSSKKKQAKKKDVPIPPDWQPTDSHRDTANRVGLDLALEVRKFKAHAEANARTQVSWNGAFAMWLANAEDYAKRDGRLKPNRDPSAGARITRADLEAMERAS